MLIPIPPNPNAAATAFRYTKKVVTLVQRVDWEREVGGHVERSKVWFGLGKV